MPDTLDKVWADDLLNRRADAALLFDFLVRRYAERKEAGQRGAYVLNLNASWGHGKSFFMERFKRQLEAGGYVAAAVNAWRDDSSKEPVIAVMSAIELSLKPYFAEENAASQAWAAAKANSATILASLGKGIVKQIVRKGIGSAVDEIEEILSEEELVSSDVENALVVNSEKAGKTITKDVTTLLTKYIDKSITEYQARLRGSTEFWSRMSQILSSLKSDGSINTPFFVLVDELDRCRPTYAIEMLEQIKHLFDVDVVVFIISKDSDQLSHAIRSVYGERFDGKRYLNRFFHRHYKFEERDLKEFVDFLFKSNKIDLVKIQTPFNLDPGELFSGAMKAYGVTLRDAE